MADFVRVPPDSTGKRLLTKEHTVDGLAVQVQNMQVTSPDDPTHIQKVDENGSAYIRFREGQNTFDGFSKLKLSQSYMVGYYEFSVDGYSDLFFTDLQNSGSSTFTPEESCTVLTTPTTNNAKSEMTSNRYHYYSQGASVLITLAASCGDTGKANNSRKWGYFDDDRGRFFVLDETGLGVGRRSSITGSPVDYVVYQDNWNVDKLDGTGISGIDLDPTKMYLYWIDWAFPAVGTRFGIFNSHGTRIVCHQLETSGSNAFPYTLNANLPIRYSNINTGVSGSSSELRFVAAAVFSETRDPNYTFWRYGGMGCSLKSATTNTPLVSLKSKTLLTGGVKNRINVFPETLEVFCNGGEIKLDVVSHTASSYLLTGDTWTIDNGSTLLCDVGSTAIDSTSSDYWVMKTYYCQEGINHLPIKEMFELNDEGILLMANEDQQVLSFVATKLNSGDTVTVSLDVSTRELW
jgi:hypothetical protein